MDWLHTICADSQLEHQWIDMLSQLEYVGARKILKAVPYDEINLDVLQHISEESLHAYLLKSLLKDTPREASTWGTEAFSQLGWRYFKALDEQCSALITPSYQWVSWAIERRVLEMYPAYLKATQDERVKRVIRQILAQEQRHGTQFEGACADSNLRQKAAEIENQLWSELEQGICTIIERCQVGSQTPTPTPNHYASI